MDYVEAPSFRDTLEPMKPAISEPDFRLEHQISDGARDQHFTGTRFGGYPRPDMNRDTDHLPTDDLVLARMQTRSDLKAESSHRVTN